MIKKESAKAIQFFCVQRFDICFVEIKQDIAKPATACIHIQLAEQVFRVVVDRVKIHHLRTAVYRTDIMQQLFACRICGAADDGKADLKSLC